MLPVRASVELFKLGVPRTYARGSIFGRIVRQGYRFSAFSYAKPSDFRRNFRPTRIEATKIFVGLQVFLVTISKDGLHMLHI